MSKAEVQPLVATVGSGSKVMLPFLLGHSIPLRSTLLIDPILKVSLFGSNAV